MGSRRLRRPRITPTVFHGMVTASDNMRAVFDRVRRVARSEATVLVRGPSGVGKELAARAIHLESARSAQPFQAVNCATFTAELLASELFGHVRGAFTGAVRDRVGLLDQADGGTLFLDELAELPLELQSRLLRVLQERRFTPVGGTDPRTVDIRLVSATNASLRALVRQGRFREDLMYRVRVVVLFLPPLRERPSDLAVLTWHFIDAFNTQGLRHVHAIDGDAWEAMLAYDWPGNVRELRNNIEQAFVLGDGPSLQLDTLAPELRGIEPDATDEHPAAPLGTLDELRRTALLEAFERTGGRRAEMAEQLGVSRSTLYRRMKHYGLI